MTPAHAYARSLVLGTANRKKAAELIDLAGAWPLEIVTLADLDNPLDVDETATTFAENAALKASQQAAHLNRWVLGDDSGLVVAALDGAPGVYSARYAGVGAGDAANRAKLLEALAGIEPARRGAYFVCHLALADPTGTIRATSEGRSHGRIRSAESGSGGFGYDPLFEVLEYHRTFGELSAAVKGCLSHRARAMYQIGQQIAELIDSGKWDALG